MSAQPFNGDTRRLTPLLGLLWSPLAAVTTCCRNETNAQICIAIGAASIVPEQPRLVVQIYKRNHSHDLIYRSGALTINFLGGEQLPWIRDFGLVSGRERDKLAGHPWQPGATGCPVLQDGWGHLDCQVINAMDGGDLTCFLVQVVAGDVLHPDTGPLTWREARRLIPAEWRAAWERKQAEEIAFSRQRMPQIDYSPWRGTERHGTGN